MHKMKKINREKKLIIIRIHLKNYEFNYIIYILLFFFDDIVLYGVLIKLILTKRDGSGEER